MSENDVTKGILDYLRLQKYHVYKIYNGGVPACAKGNIITYKKKLEEYKGVPDIIALKKDYPILFIEVKDKGNKPSEEQIEFLKLVNSSNGPKGIVAYSLEDIIKLVK